MHYGLIFVEFNFVCGNGRDIYFIFVLFNDSVSSIESNVCTINTESI
jgi:hypothetical protein